MEENEEKIFKKRLNSTMRAISAFNEKYPGKVNAQDIMECPECKGRLHLSKCSYNGHVWGKCETEGCLTWMQ